MGATLDILIPPSVAMVLYGILTGQLIGKLLIAGIGPGIILCVVTRRLTWVGALGALKETVRTPSMIFMILIGGMIFGYYMTLSQVPQKAIEVVAAMNINRWWVIIGITVAYFVVSMFMDEIPLMLITVQIAYPLVVHLGFDPIWFGLMVIMMVIMGLVFSPVGMIAFIVSATANVDLVKVYNGTVILIFAVFATTVLIMIFPEIVLWLPSTMY